MLPHRIRNYFLRADPNFLGIVLHPSGLRINLAVFFLRGSDNVACAVKHDETRACGSLIERSDITRQISHP
jgi:hypothetical protein